MLKLVMLVVFALLTACSAGKSQLTIKHPAKLQPSALFNKTVNENYVKSVNVNFNLDSFKITKEEKKRLDTFLNKLRKSGTNYLLHISGYTDDLGTKKYNDRLAFQRVMSIRRYLLNKKVPKEYLITSSNGKCCYIAENTSEKNRKRNRRVEIDFLNTFFVLDFKENNLEEVLRRISVHYPNNTFIVVNKNGNTNSKMYSEKALRLLKQNGIQVKPLTGGKDQYADWQVIVAVAGSHPSLLEPDIKELWGNAEEEITFDGTRYVVRKKAARTPPKKRSMEEVFKLIQNSKSKERKLQNTKQTDLGKRIEKNLGFHLDDNILEGLNEIN